MTLSLSFKAPTPSPRGGETMRLLLVGMAALPLGLVLDRWFGLLPALTSHCGGSGTLLGTLAWHWACMPATCLMMLFAGPAWIAVEALAPVGRAGAAQRDGRSGAFAAGVCHVAMLAGMAGVQCAGPTILALAGLPWTGGAAIGAMTLGMACGIGAASFWSGRIKGCVRDANPRMGRRSSLC
jgi:hypothetical protein